jgi:hypothetical protein
MTLLDRIFGPLALLAFGGYLFIIIAHVPKPGLVVVCIVCFLLCAYDFARSAVIRRWRERRSGPGRR